MATSQKTSGSVIPIHAKSSGSAPAPILPVAAPAGKPAAKTGRASEQKWGKAVVDLGFSVVPSLLLWAQARLGITPTQLALLMHLADYWWEADNRPRPSKQTLADRMGLSARQVQRCFAELEGAGLVRRIERRGVNRGKQANEYDLSGLVKRLKALAPEVKKAKEEARERKRAATRPGIRPRAKGAA